MNKLDFETQSKCPISLFQSQRQLFFLLPLVVRSSCVSFEVSYPPQNYLLMQYQLSKVNISVYYILCGYQCDKAMTKNDTREVISYHFTAVK